MPPTAEQREDRYTANFREKLSDNPRNGSLWTLEEAQNDAKSAVSAPFVPPNASTRWPHNDLSDSFEKVNSRKSGCRTLYRSFRLGQAGRLS
jgi:hypothetical protein